MEKPRSFPQRVQRVEYMDSSALWRSRCSIHSSIDSSVSLLLGMGVFPDKWMGWVSRCPGSRASACRAILLGCGYGSVVVDKKIRKWSPNVFQ
jgi:hypothetical protein